MWLIWGKYLWFKHSLFPIKLGFPNPSIPSASVKAVSFSWYSFFFLVCFYKHCLLLNNVALFEQDSLLAQLHFGRAVSAFAGNLAPSFGLAGYLLPLFAQCCVAVNHFTEWCCSFSIKGLCLLFPADATTQAVYTGYQGHLPLLTSAYSWNAESPSAFQ